MVICEKDLCCGCGLCGEICPQKAISMKEDDLGFRYPFVDESKCLSCGLCEKKCTSHYASICAEAKEMKELAVYIGFATNNDEILQSSSGGIVRQLAKEILIRGGHVFGVRYSDNLEGAEYVLIDSVEKLSIINKSKYVETKRDILFSELKASICSKNEVLVIGLGCDIAAVRSFVGFPNNLITCRIVCMATTSTKAFRQYITDYESKEKSKVVNIDMRYKDGVSALFPTKVCLEFENGEKRVGFWEDQDLYKAFFLMNRPSCHKCNYKHRLKDADIIVGDYHGVSQADSTYNKQGVSLVIAPTAKGKVKIEENKNCSVQRVYDSSIIDFNWMIQKEYPKQYFSDSFASSFLSFGLSKATKELVEYNNSKLERVTEEIISNNYRVYVWGSGDTLTNLSDKIRIREWNIVDIFDGNKIKEGRIELGHRVLPFCKMSDNCNGADVVVSFIPSLSDDVLDRLLLNVGWEKKRYHIGKYKYYR